MEFIHGTLISAFSLTVFLGTAIAFLFSRPLKQSTLRSILCKLHLTISEKKVIPVAQPLKEQTPHHDSDEESDFDSEADSDYDGDDLGEDIKTVKQQRKQRLRELGLFRYLKSYFDLIPDIWPSRDKVLLFGVAAMLLQKVADSLLNVLVHHQESKAINILWDASQRSTLQRSSASSGQSNTGPSMLDSVPYREVGIWLIYKWLGPHGLLSACLKPLEIRVQSRLDRAAYRAAFDQVMGLSMDYHDDKASYHTLSAMDCSVCLYSVCFQLVFDIAPIILDLAIAYVYFFYRFDWQIALLVIVVTLAYTFLTRESSKWIKSARKRDFRAYKHFNQAESESVTNWKTVVAFNHKTYQKKLFTEALDEKIAAGENEDLTFTFYYELLSIFTHAGLAAACFLVIHRILNGLNSPGEFILIVKYWQSIQSPLRYLSSSYKYFQRGLTELERFFNLMLAQQSVKNKPGALSLKFNGGQVKFEGVSFFYHSDKTILKDLNFVAEPGQTVAFVGETGGGKSTIMKLLPRFYDVQTGSIEIDGQDIRNVTQESLRDVFGIVPQDATLFNKSIMDNVRYGRLDATDDEVHDACRAAAVHDKIMTFAKGYKSKAGEGGVKLSGGELQRIAIARTILKQPKIVLLDEATSAVDTETERNIQEGLRKLCAGRTTFVVAHRLSTVIHADLILVIDNGQIVERGTHSQLIDQGCRYANLIRQQFEMDVNESSNQWTNGVKRQSASND